jgi:methanogenic corrinoid protein MtbC1
VTKLEEVKAMVEEGEPKLVPSLVQEALDEGSPAETVLQALIDTMAVVGDKFSSGEIYIPEMLMAAKAMSKGVDALKPFLAGGSTSSLGTCIIGTVEGDLHDIGKKLVAMMIESAGFNIVDLGVDVPAAKWLKAIEENQNTTLVACSGLLTTTMPAMRETVQAIKGSGPSGLKVIVGGAPVTQKFADAIGADGFSEDAGGAAVIAAELVKSVER